MENFNLYNIAWINLFDLPLFYLFVMFLCNIDVIGNVFYFIPSFHFIILFNYTLMLWVIILLYPDVMGN